VTSEKKTVYKLNKDFDELKIRKSDLIFEDETLIQSKVANSSLH